MTMFGSRAVGRLACSYAVKTSLESPDIFSCIVCLMDSIYRGLRSRRQNSMFCQNCMTTRVPERADQTQNSQTVQLVYSKPMPMIPASSMLELDIVSQGGTRSHRKNRRACCEDIDARNVIGVIYSCIAFIGSRRSRSTDFIALQRILFPV